MAEGEDAPKFDSLEAYIERMKQIMKEFGGRMPSPDESEEFWQLVDEVYEFYIKSRKTSWGGLARLLGVNENTLKTYYRKWRQNVAYRVGILPSALAKLVYEKIRQELKKPFDRLTAEFVYEVLEYGLIVKREFEHVMRAKGKDVKQALIEALYLYMEYGDKFRDIITENERLKNVVAVQQIALREMELALKGLMRYVGAGG